MLLQSPAQFSRVFLFLAHTCLLVQTKVFRQKLAKPLSEEDHHLLDRVKANFLELMEDPPMLENTVILAPLIDHVFGKLYNVEAA